MDTCLSSSYSYGNLHTLEQSIWGLKVDLALVDKLIGRQRQIIVDLEKSGQDAEIAKILLREAKEVRAVYAADAARLEWRRVVYEPYRRPTVDADEGDKDRGLSGV